MVVYAMRVSQKMSMQDYDAFIRFELLAKIPELKSRESRRRVGDSLYDFSTSVPRLRPGVHGEGNRDTDLGGRWVLLSDHFFYFGDRPVALPEALLGIVKRGQGHRSTANVPFVEDFVRWIGGLGILLVRSSVLRSTGTSRSPNRVATSSTRKQPSATGRQ